jgi:hypothetical protein
MLALFMKAEETESRRRSAADEWQIQAGDTP